MPYASEAQRRKFHFLLSQGKISPEIVKEFDEASKGLDLPERLHPKKEPKEVEHTPTPIETRLKKLQARRGWSDGELAQRFPSTGTPKEVGVYTVKSSDHPAQRMDERTGFHPSNVRQVQRLVDMIGLSPGNYHLPLRDESGGVGGYAVFKGVKDRKTPVLATVYGKDMRPPGQDIESLLKTPPKLKFKTS